MGLQVAVILVVTLLAVVSVIRGIDGGVKVISNINMIIAFVLLALVGLIGWAVSLGSIPTTIMAYVENIIPLSNPHGRNDEAWLQGWTVFYWAWWISWSPFVGIFIARISKGRTIREFIFGVLLVPTLMTMLWMTVFGGSAIYQELFGNHAITDAVNGNVATAIYHLLEQYPLTTFSSILTVILVASFFVTSSDSGSFVVDTLTSGGRHDAPKGQKIFWASTEGLLAAVLLIGGGLTALQTASILTAIPFASILIVMCYSFYKSLKEYKEE